MGANLFSNLATELAATERLKDPVVWAKEKAGIELWSKQQEIVRSVQEHKQTAVRSAHGTGKSLLAAVLACWWIDTHPVGTAYVISTAPSRQQVHSVLWEEMRNIHTKAKLQGEIQVSDKWNIQIPGQKQKEVGIGRRPADHQPHSFQGIHRDAVLFILDEAGGIPKWLWDAGIAITTNDESRTLAIGNPDDPNSEFRQKFNKKDSAWHQIKISIFDSPNFTGEPVSAAAAKRLSDRSYVQTAELEWGIGTGIWQSKVEGEFPDEDENAVIPISWVHDAFNRFDLYDDLPKVVLPELEQGKIVSVDVAYTGRDKTVIAQYKHPTFTKFEESSPRSQKELFLSITEVANRRLDKIVIDVGGGYGQGVFEMLRDAGYSVVAFSGGNKTSKKDSTRQFMFTRVRSAAFWKVRELLNPSREPQLAFPRLDKVEGDLTTPKYEIQLDKIQVETKDSIRKRLRRSTDYGDTIMMALWVGSPVSFEEDFTFAYDVDDSDDTAVYRYEQSGGELDDSTGTFAYDGY